MAARPIYRDRAAGFTLLEIMVVVLLIGIILGFAGLSVRGLTRADSEQEAQRLAGLLSIALEEAVLNSREMAVDLTPGGYAFLVFDGDQREWLPIEDDEVLRAREFPAGVRAQVSVDEVPANDEEDGFDVGDDGLGLHEEEGDRIYMLSSGELTPFKITLAQEGGGVAWTVDGLLTGEVRAREADAKDGV